MKVNYIAKMSDGNFLVCIVFAKENRLDLVRYFEFIAWAKIESVSNTSITVVLTKNMVSEKISEVIEGMEKWTIEDVQAFNKLVNL